MNYRLSYILFISALFLAACDLKPKDAPISPDSLNDIALQFGACDKIPHGSYDHRVRFQQMSVPSNIKCAYEEQEALCTNGALGPWSGTFTFTDCEALPADLATPTWLGNSKSTTEAKATASWGLTNDPTRVSLAAQFYPGESCEGVAFRTEKIESLSGKLEVEFKDNLKMSFRLEAKNRLNDKKTSGCVGIERAVPPAPATGLAWEQPNPYPGLQVDAKWTPSVGAKLTQDFLMYAGSNCSTSPTVTRLSPSASGQKISGSWGAKRSFKIRTTNAFKQTSESACSGEMHFYISDPQLASNLRWNSTSFTNTLLSMSWTPSSSQGVARQSISVYTDRCVGTPQRSGFLSPTASTISLNVIGNSNYWFKINTEMIDGRTLNGPCSPMISMFALPPAPPSLVVRSTAKTITLSWPQSAPAPAGAPANPPKSNITIAQAATPVPASAIAPTPLPTPSATPAYLASESVGGALVGSTASWQLVGLDMSSGVTVARVTLVRSDRSWTFVNARSGVDYLWTLSALNSTGAATSGSSFGHRINLTPATNLAWSNGSWSQTISASWTPAPQNFDRQQINIYANASCIGSPLYSFSVGTEMARTISPERSGDYSFKVLTFATPGSIISIESICSPAGKLRRPPVAATNLRWDNSTDGLYLRALWTPSADPETQSERVQLFEGYGCNYAVGSAPPIENRVGTQDFMGSFSHTYSFRVLTKSSNGLQATSTCSDSNMVYFSGPRTISWAVGSPMRQIIAVKGIASQIPQGGLVDAAVMVYQSESCEKMQDLVATEQVVPEGKVGRFSLKWTPTDKTSYAFRTTLTYLNGFRWTSPCSNSLVVDTEAEEDNFVILTTILKSKEIKN